MTRHGLNPLPPRRGARQFTIESKQLAIVVL
jgi:hypothetical protein